MKRKNLLCIIVAMLFCVIAFSQENNNSNKKVVDKVVAIIGQNIIKLSDIENMYLQGRTIRGNENVFETKCEFLEDYMKTKLMVHQAAVDSVIITDEEVDARLEQFISEKSQEYGSIAALERVSGKSVQELKDFYRPLFKDNMTMQHMQQGIIKDVKITPREINEYYLKISKDSLETIGAEYELLQITRNPQVNNAENERVKESLNKLRERILKGEKFSTLAALYSEDPASAKKGGELGLFKRGVMVSDFESVAFGLKPGEVSPVIETKYGFHIIQLIERRGDMINARHILMIPKVSPEDLQQAKYFLDSISILIKNKTYTFEEAAAKFSDDPSKTNGGTVVNPRTSSTRISTEAAKWLDLRMGIDKMNEGDISVPTLMKTEAGQEAYRIVYLKTKIKEHKLNLTDDYNAIYQAALYNAQIEQINKWTAKKIENTYIKIFDDYKNCNFELNWLKK